MEMGGELVWQWTVTQRAPRYRAAVALIFEKLLFHATLKFARILQASTSSESW